MPDIVRQTTTAAAESIGRQETLGTLKVGTVADLAAFEIQEGKFQYHDVRDNLESLIARSGGDTSLHYRVMQNGEPVGELHMRDLVKALVPRVSSNRG